MPLTKTFWAMGAPPLAVTADSPAKTSAIVVALRFLYFVLGDFVVAQCGLSASGFNPNGTQIESSVVLCIRECGGRACEKREGNAPRSGGCHLFHPSRCLGLAEDVLNLVAGLIMTFLTKIVRKWNILT